MRSSSLSWVTSLRSGNPPADAPRRIAERREMAEIERVAEGEFVGVRAAAANIAEKLAGWQRIRRDFTRRVNRRAQGTGRGRRGWRNQAVVAVNRRPPDFRCWRARFRADCRHIRPARLSSCCSSSKLLWTMATTACAPSSSSRWSILAPEQASLPTGDDQQRADRLIAVDERRTHGESQKSLWRGGDRRSHANHAHSRPGRGIGGVCTARPAMPCPSGIWTVK